MSLHDIVRYRDGHFVPAEDDVVSEERVGIEVNGREIAGLMALPSDLEQLALGYVFSEELIESIHDVQGIAVDQSELLVRIRLHSDELPVQRPEFRAVTSGCGHRISRVEPQQAQRFFPIDSVYRHDIQTILNAMRELMTHSTVFRETGGVHTVGLMRDNRFHCIFDDIGRHNAFDKAIGQALRTAWPLSEDSIIMTTGRISSDMVLKAIRARAPVLVSRSAPTKLSVALAERFGITLIGFARLDRCNLYSHISRIRITGVP